MAGDYYGLLGVARTASDDDIKKAYRRLARELHPDTNPDPAAEDRFKEITLAYETLRDPERRRRYDMFGPEGAAASAGGDPFGGGFGAGGLNDIFEAFFGNAGGGFGGGGGRRGGPGRGPDAELGLQLGFREAVFGATHEVTARLQVPCRTCNGSGARPGTSPVRCTTCGGAGEVRRVRQSILGQVVTAAPCQACHGLGEEITSPCGDCHGDGRVTDEVSYSVEVPPGVDDGTTLRLTGRGHAGGRGAPPGDLYVHLRVRPHEAVRREGDDLVQRIHVPMTVAALGATLPIHTLDGEETLELPRGTQSGTVVTFRRLGVPRLDGRGRGDLLVEVVVDTPTDLDARQEELLRELAVERREDVAAHQQGFLAKLKAAFK